MIAKGIIDRKAEVTQSIPGGGIKISTTFIVNSGEGLRIYQNHNQEGYCPLYSHLAKKTVINHLEDHDFVRLSALDNPYKLRTWRPKNGL